MLSIDCSYARLTRIRAQVLPTSNGRLEIRDPPVEHVAGDVGCFPDAVVAYQQYFKDRFAYGPSLHRTCITHYIRQCMTAK